MRVRENRAGLATLTSASPAKQRLPPARRARRPLSIAQRIARRQPPLLPRRRTPPRPSEPARHVRVLRTLPPGGGGGAVPAALPRRMPCRFRNVRIRAWLALRVRRACRTRGGLRRGYLR